MATRSTDFPTTAVPATAVPADAVPASGGPAPSRRRAGLVLAMIVVFMVVNYADKAVLGLAAVPIMDELGISKSTYGLISSSFYLLFSLAGLAVGFVSTRFSSRAILFVLTLVWAVAQAPVLLIAAVPTLIASRVLLGAAEGPAASMSMHALYKWFPLDKRGLPSALQISGAALGTVIAAPVLTWFITQHGWRSAFLFLAVISLVWSLVWLRTGHDGPYRGGGKVVAGAPAAVDGPALPYRRLLLNGTVLGSISSAFGAHCALTLASAWLPVYLTSELDLGPARVAAVVSGVSLLSFVLLLLITPLVDVLTRRGVPSRWSRGAGQGIAVVVSGVAMAAFPFVGSTGPRLVLIAVAFGVHAVSLPLHYMTTAEVVPTRQRGAVFGIFAATGTLPGLVVPFVAGHLVESAATESAGYTAAFLATAGIMLVTGLYAIAAIRPARDAARLVSRG
jgi:MFS family permease